MTIIQPNKNSSKTNFLILVLMLGSISAVVWGVFIYNQLVDLRHEVKSQETGAKQAEVANAELKDNLYNIIDAKSAESLKNSQSLILDKNPEYVKISGNQQLTTNN